MQEGIYEQIINEKINQYLSKLDEDKFKYEVESLDVEEAKIYLANYISEITTRALSIIRENKSAKKSLIHQIQLCNILIDTLRTELNDEDFAELRLDEKGEVLKAIYNKVNNIYSFHNKKNRSPSYFYC